MILHPWHRNRWISFELPGEQVNRITITFKQLYQEHYSTPNTLVPVADGHGNRSRSSHLARPGYYDPDGDGDDDEVTRYLEGRVREVEDPLMWWRTHCDEFPRLFKMAIDFLMIPARSNECECQFSKAKLIVAIQRQSLHDKTISQVQTLKQWHRNRRK